MDTVTKAILFDGKAIVSVVNVTDLCDFIIKKQELNDAAAQVLSRYLAYTAFFSAGIKGTDIKMSITVDCDGAIGKVITAGSSGGLVRGYVSNKNINLPPKENGGVDIATTIGKGSMTLIKDFGMKEPYVARTELVNGDIDSDFAYYFNVSEQLTTVCISGANINNGVCSSAGLILVQPMPNCDENILCVLEDIVRNFKNVADLLQVKSAEEIIQDNFGHFECKVLDPITPEYRCTCSKERIDSMIFSMKYDDAIAIIDEIGKIEVHCDFCNTYYQYDKCAVDKLFGVNE